MFVSAALVSVTAAAMAVTSRRSYRLQSEYTSFQLRNASEGVLPDMYVISCMGVSSTNLCGRQCCEEKMQ